MSDGDRQGSLPEMIDERYRVLSPLGAGGMGAVYKGIDTRLNRPVAIKAIAGHLGGEDERHRARLRSEAMAAASLDHPYICKVYELIEEPDRTFIVMEFVEGEPLSSLLRRGPLPLARLLSLGREIAEGLAAAHAHGIVHRDVKPSNVMVTAHGHAKLLDFGLAVADGAAVLGERTHTSPGSGVGTPQYMAPEQASGEPVTPRADLFSFGVLLYECLAGSLPFAGTTAYDYVRHVLSDPPRPLHRTAPDAPFELTRLIERCLEKSPSSRPQSAASIVDELGRLTETMARPGAALPTARAVRDRRVRLLVLAALAGVGMVFGGARWWLRSLDTDRTFRQQRPLITWPTAESSSRLSPDGRWLSFLSTGSGKTQVYVQAVQGTEAKLVPLGEGQPMSQVWAPDGQEIACALRQGKRVEVQIVPAFFGGTVRASFVLDPPPIRVRLLRWIGRTLFLQIEHGRRALFQLDLDRGVLRDVSGSWSVAGLPGAFDVRPDGKRVTFTVLAHGEEDLWTATLDGGDQRRLTRDSFIERSPLWSGKGDTIVYRSNRGGQIDLWEIDAESSRSWPLTSSPTQEIPDSTSADGTLISYEQGFEDAKLWLWDQAGGTSQQLTAGALNDFAPVTTRKGKAVAFQRSQPTPSQVAPIVDSQIFVGSLRGSELEPGPTAVADGFAARLSPDGAWLAYLRHGQQAGQVGLELKELRTDQTVTLSSACPLPATSPFPLDWAEQTLAWNPAGTELYFVEERGVQRLCRHRLGGGAREPPLLTLRAGEFVRDVYPSPDGRGLAYLVWSQGAYALHVLDLGSGRDRQIIRVPGDRTSVYCRGWIPGARALLLIRVVSFGADPGSAQLEVLRASLDGSVARLATIDHGFVATSRVNDEGTALYVTCSRDGIHNLYMLSLANGALRPVTDNAVPGVTFSGVTPSGRGRVIGVRSERKQDIWLSEARR